jgi:hypothetical protein
METPHLATGEVRGVLRRVRNAATVKDALGRGLRPVGSYAGRVASVTDKAQKTVLAYDGRGRFTGRLKRVALVDPTNPSQPKALARAAGSASRTRGTKWAAS